MYYYEDEDQMSLDIGVINKFAILKITAPLQKSQIEKAIQELEELEDRL